MRRATIPVFFTIAAVVALAVYPGVAAYAYIGPGAGFALAGSFFAVLSALLAGVATILVWPIRFVVRRYRRRKNASNARVGRVIILGLDGLDPGLTEKWLEAGHLPNLARLKSQGSFDRLQTTYPSISPVAWASFMTGVGPSRQNIFDFIDSNPPTNKPRFYSSEFRE
jgi:hypothetical protein